MNNLSSYCGLIDAKIRAYDKDLPVVDGKKMTRNGRKIAIYKLEIFENSP